MTRNRSKGLAALVAAGFVWFTLPAKADPPRWTEDRIAVLDAGIRDFRTKKLEGVERELAQKLGSDPVAVRNDLELLSRWDFYHNLPVDIPSEERNLPDPGSGSGVIGNPKIGPKASLAQLRAILKEADNLITGAGGTQANGTNLDIVKQRKDWLTSQRINVFGSIVARGTIPVATEKLNEALGTALRQGKEGVLIEYLGPRDGFDKLDRLATEARGRLSKAPAEFQKAMTTYGREFPGLQAGITLSQVTMPKTIRMEEAIAAKAPASGSGKWAVAAGYFMTEQSGGLLGVKPGDPVWFEVTDQYAIRSGTNEQIATITAEWNKQNQPAWGYRPQPVSRVLSVFRHQARTLAHAQGLTEAERDRYLADIRAEMEGVYGKLALPPNNLGGMLSGKFILRPLPQVAASK